MFAATIAITALALIFAFTNGFHDAANSIATSVSTRALTPRVALGLAAVMNLLGAMLGTEVAQTIGSGIIRVEAATGLAGLLTVLGGLVGAIVWNLITWWLGLPSSSTHALIGGLAGAGLGGGLTVHWETIVDKVLLPLLISPVVGFLLAYLVMRLLLKLLAGFSYHRTMDNFRFLQTISAAAMALGHGLQDAQKTMGVIAIGLFAGGMASPDVAIPLWVKLVSALALALGTFAGGTRIIRTLGSGVIELDPARGFVAETVSASLLYTASLVFGAPISTTQSISSSIMGVGATRRFSDVRWRVVGRILLAWLLTLPAAGLIGAACTRLAALVLL